MRALSYHGPGRITWEPMADPEITHDLDAVIRVDTVTICGTDLNILRGDVPEVASGRILGHEAVGTVHLEDQWARDITITTGLVDTSSTPTLLRLLAGGQIEAGRFVTHHFALEEFAEAYDVFGRAAETGALKVVLSRRS